MLNRDILLKASNQFTLHGENVVRLRTGRLVSNNKPNSSGKYVQVAAKVDGRNRLVLLHALKFVLHHGFVPESVDHIDGNPQNNALSNLRAATRVQQMQNRGRFRRKKGDLPRGVHLIPSGRYQAVVRERGSYRHLGVFDCPDAASKAVEGRLRELHGEFYRSHSG